MNDDIKKIKLEEEQKKEGSEINIMNKIHKKRFIALLKIFNINLGIVLGKKPHIRDLYKFNLFLRKIKDQHSFDIKDSMLFIEEDYTKFRRIIKLLDERNKAELERELAKIIRELNYQKTD